VQSAPKTRIVAAEEKIANARAVPAVATLYFPHVQFRSIDWLKSALLYWEKVKRIVPEGFGPEDPPEVRSLVEAGLVEDVSPAPFRDAARARFHPRFAALAKSRNGRFPWSTLERAATVLHPDKLDERLQHELADRGLARASGDWLEVEPQVAALYLTVLAAEAGEHHGTPLTTDAFAIDVAGIYLATEGEPTPTSDGSALARTAVRFPAPAALSGVSIDRILKIREKYGLERTRFRELFQATSAELATLSSREAIADHLAVKKANFELELKAQTEILDEARASNVWDFINISTPAAVAAGGALVGASPVVLGIGTAVSLVFGAVNWFGGHRGRKRDAAASTPLHYLIPLAHELGIEESVTRFDAGMQQLIYD
jgi:hypothetical protein